MTLEPTISAIVLSFNSNAYLSDCIRSLLEVFQELAVSGDVWVVENGSHDGSAATLKSLEREFAGLVRGIYETENTGTTRSRNKAIKASRGEFVLVLDSDATATSGAVAGTLEILRSDPTVGIAVPRLNYPNGEFQLSTDVFPTIPRKLERFKNLRSLETEFLPPTELTEVDYAISAFWMVRRSVFDEVGLLDEAITYSPEDVDFCLRTWLAGYRIVWDPTICAIHDAQELSRTTKLSKFLWLHGAGLIYYFRKHHCFFSRKGLYRNIASAVTKRQADLNTANP